MLAQYIGKLVRVGFGALPTNCKGAGVLVGYDALGIMFQDKDDDTARFYPWAQVGYVEPLN